MSTARIKNLAFALSDARRGGSVPRVHGNGFIQVDLTDRGRVHVWNHPGIPHQKVWTPIHDHVFGFISTVVVGRMVNVSYQITLHKKGEWAVYSAVARDGEETVLEHHGYRCGITPGVPDVVTAGQAYTMEPFEFHETFPAEPTVTMMLKDGPTLAQGANTAPRVLVPSGVEPDNEFSRFSAPAVELWRITEEVLGMKIPY